MQATVNLAGLLIDQAQPCTSVPVNVVFKKNCGAGLAGVPANKDADFENYIEQDFLTLVQVDFDIGVQARRLLRAHQKLKKPADAIHLASAVLSNVDELHTFDNENLTPSSGVITRQDGVALTICFPAEPPPPQTLPPMPLFDSVEPGPDPA